MRKEREPRLRSKLLPVRFSALRALSVLGTSVSASDLATALSDSVLQAPALILLGSSEDEAAVSALLKGLSESSRLVREAAMRALYQDTHNMAEGAGAAATAALLQERERMAGKKVGVILSGGNMDIGLYRAVLAEES